MPPVITVRFDLLVLGGHVVDPRERLDGIFDIAVTSGRIAAVDRRIPVETANQVVNAQGLLVLPGLIDLHTHVFHQCTYWGVNPDIIAASSGVTTWIDAGSSGAVNFGGLREFVMNRATVRVRAFINVSCIGLTAPDLELSLPEYLDRSLLDRVIRRYGDEIAGLKVRMSSPTVGASGTKPMEIARDVADKYGLPIMVHVSNAPPDITDVLSLMRDGDILTHCFNSGTMKLIDASGLPLIALRRALDRGVLLDVGHGAGSFSFESAEALIDAGIYPHTISTDLHQMSRHGSAVVSSDALASPIIHVTGGTNDPLDLPQCMSKFLALGFSLSDVVAATTERPARILKSVEEIGTLRVGARADFALFKLAEGDFTYGDVEGRFRRGKQRLHNMLTFFSGEILRTSSKTDVAPWVVRLNEDDEESELLANQ